LKIGVGVERLIFFGLLLFVSIHVISCIWVFIADFEGWGPNTWIAWKGYEDFDTFDLYAASFYYTVTTLTTVGYGDITSETTLEKWFSIFLMLLGVAAFSFSTGALSSILSSLDSANANLKSDLDTLDLIKR
jgi:hypothetical protein